MRAIGTFFDEMTLLILPDQPRHGGIRLPEWAKIVPLRSPVGVGTRRKLFVLSHLRYYLSTIIHHVRAADVVYVTPPGDMPFLGMLVALALRKRLIAWFVVSWFADSQTTVWDRLTRACMRRFAGGRNVMLALSPVRLMTAPGPNMHWISDATILSKDSVAAARPDLTRPLHKPLRLVYVGRLVPLKGVAHIIEALSILRKDKDFSDRFPHLTIIGDGPQRSALEELVRKHGCQDAIRFTGNLAHEELVVQLLDTDLCILPSLSEGSCKARLDAMLCGVPVITTEAGFGHEVVGAEGERGWLVPSGDTMALVAALRRVISEPIDWAALRRRCKDYAEARTIETWADQIRQICTNQWGSWIIEGT